MLALAGSQLGTGGLATPSASSTSFSSSYIPTNSLGEPNTAVFQDFVPTTSQTPGDFETPLIKHFNPILRLRIFQQIRCQEKIMNISTKFWISLIHELMWYHPPTPLIIYKVFISLHFWTFQRQVMFWKIETKDSLGGDKIPPFSLTLWCVAM